MLFVYIFGGILLFLIISCFILCLVIHNMYFNHRFVEDSDIKLFSFDEFDLEKEAVEIPFNKKEYLRGAFYYKEGYNPKKIVVYSHGMFSDHKSYMQDIAYFALKGYFVLGFDYYGTSLSDGKNLKSFGNSLESLDKAICFLKNNPKYSDKEIYVVGHSWGGYATCNIVSLHPDIKGICAISPFNSSYEIIKTSIPKGVRFLAPIVYFIDFCIGKKYSKFKGYKSVSSYQGKVMLVQSKNDHVVKFDIGVGEIKEKTTNKNVLYIINDGRYHNPNYTDEALQMMFKFYQESSKLKGEELSNYKKNFDFHKMGELDSNIMDRIVSDIIEG